MIVYCLVCQRVPPFLSYLYLYYDIRRPIWLKKNLSGGALFVAPFITRKSRANCGFIMGHARFIARKSRDYFVNPPHTQKSLLGEAQKVIPQKARFSLEKREKKRSFFVNQPYENDWLTKNEH